MKPVDHLINLVLSVFLIVGVYQFYFWCRRNHLARLCQLRLALDDAIPYRPRWVWIHSGLYYPIIATLKRSPTLVAAPSRRKNCWRREVLVP